MPNVTLNRGEAADGADLTTGGFDDGVVELVYGEPDPNADPQYVGGVQAVLSAGNLAKGMAADASFLSLVDKTAGVYVEDAAVTQQTFYRKLA